MSALCHDQRGSGRHREPPVSCVPVQVNIPLWALVHLPVVVTVTTAAFTPGVRMLRLIAVIFAMKGLSNRLKL